MRQWGSNYLKFMESLPECEKFSSNVVNALGLLWNLCDDTFSIPGGDKISESDKATKYDVLHSISRVFDQLGFLSPVVFYGKVLLQNLWSLNVPWDESLPVELLKEWHLIVDQLTEISEFKIPRIAGDINGGESYQLLIFCDASEKAYAGIVYLRC